MSLTFNPLRSPVALNRYFPETYSAVGDGSADDTAAVQAAADAAGTTGLLVLAPGKTYKITSTVTFKGHVMGQGSTVTTAQNYSSVAIQWGSTTANTQDMLVFFPAVTTTKTGTAWANNTGSVGIKIYNAYGSEFHLSRVSNYETGLWLCANNSKGTSYNNIFLSQLYNNKVNWLAYADDNTSWINENNTYGGRFEQDSGEGTAISGCFQIYIRARAAGLGLNNNRFWGVCFEGDGPEYHLKVDGCTDNGFYHARWEATTPKVHFNGLDATRVCTKNVIMHGYNAAAISVTQSASNASQNTLVRAQRYLAEGGGANGYLALSNTSGGTTPVLTVWNSGTNMHSLGTNAWLWALGDGQFVGKASADNTTTTGRIWMTPSNGRIYLGDGSTAIGSYLSVYGANVGVQLVSGDLAVATAGRGLRIAEGSNAKMGSVALVAGSATVSTTAVTANSRIFLDSQSGGGTPGWLRVSARTAGTSFTITSSSGSDTSTVAWMLVEPA